MTVQKHTLRIRENELLAPYTSLKIGGPARFFAEISTEGEIQEALEFRRKQNLPLFILGGGTNILVSDAGFPGLVIHVTLKGIKYLKRGSSVAVHGAAGESWDSFVSACVAEDLAGLECLSGIPGTVGGTPIQNVGAYGAEVGELIESLTIFDLEAQVTRVMQNHECKFGYRTSIFNTVRKDRYLVAGVTFLLERGADPSLTYPDLQRRFPATSQKPTLNEVREAILEIRGSKGMLLTSEDPECRSAGSFFKNPVVGLPLLESIKENFRRIDQTRNSVSLPSYAIGNGLFKIPAAWLIERAGFHKGYGNARVAISEKHALALVNRGKATSKDFLDLMDKIQKQVRVKFGVELVPEIQFVGFQ